MLKLKYYRIANRYKLKDIAKLTGVSIQAVHQWENGETNPPIDKLVKIARFYGVTVDDLIGDVEEPKGDESGSDEDRRSDLVPEDAEDRDQAAA